MMFDPIVGLIHRMVLDEKQKEVKEQSWHPVYFLPADMPGGVQGTRYKSKAHCTNGFATREEGLKAAQEVAERLKVNALGDIYSALEKDFPWVPESSTDVPAMVLFFSLDKNAKTAMPLF